MNRDFEEVKGGKKAAGFDFIPPRYPFWEPLIILSWIWRKRVEVLSHNLEGQILMGQ